MTSDFVFLVLTALLTAYGFWAALKPAPKKVAAWVAALIFLLVGAQTTLIITLQGTGEILPGRVLNPAVQNYWSELVKTGLAAGPHPSYCLVAILAHILAIVARPSKLAALLPLPATLFFCAYFFVASEPPEIFFERGIGREATGYVCIEKGDDGAELTFSAGPEEALFLPILHRHAADTAPPNPSLAWTGDGKVLVFTTRGAKPFFAIVDDGTTIGWLPDKANQWPDRTPSPADTLEMRRVLSTAQVDVARVVSEHGGLLKE
jgi:hypothetical protein